MKNLIIVFVKNAVWGHAKTRLAASIGNDAAFDVYLRLLKITENATSAIDFATVHPYFSQEIVTDRWPGAEKFVQQGKDLGEKMGDAFQRGFELGYNRIIGIGSDLPEMNQEILSDAFKSLETNDTVFGPAEDGGYYLLGMNQFYPEIFEDKPWSTEHLLQITLDELRTKGRTISTLSTLNDIDTLDDLKKSSLAVEFPNL